MKPERLSKIHKELRNLDAPSVLIRLWRKNPGCFEMLAKDYPVYYFWALGLCPSWERNKRRIDKCASKLRDLPLMWASDKISPERLDSIAKIYPAMALMYVPHLLTARRLRWCAIRHPEIAIDYASKCMTRSLVKKCLALAHVDYGFM